MEIETSNGVTGWMVLRPFLGVLAAVGAILLCARAITSLTGSLVEGEYEWLGHTIVGLAFIGILLSLSMGIRCKVRFARNFWKWVLQFGRGGQAPKAGPH